MKKKVILSIGAILLLTALLLSACSYSKGPASYTVAGAKTEIPSITAVIGDRGFDSSQVTRYADADEGNMMVTATYVNVEDPKADLKAYFDLLTDADHGFRYLEPLSDTGAVLTAESNRAGEYICVTAEILDSSSYTITVSAVDLEDETDTESQDSSAESGSESSEDVSDKDTGKTGSES